jgi:hypothetical protein
MDRNELRSVAGLLLYGDSSSVDRIAHELVANDDRRTWGVLVETIHSDEELPVRVRCLEVLARAASLGGDLTAEAVLAALGDADPSHDASGGAG